MSSNKNSWIFLVNGPTESVYNGGVFKVALFFAEDYPFSPPRIKF